MGERAAHAGRALAAGLIGSMVGTAVAIPILAPIFGVVDTHEQSHNPGLGAIAFWLFVISLFFTLSGSLLLAAPLTWPLRNWIAWHPWRAALIYGPIGALIGAAIWLVPGGDIRVPGAWLNAIYAAATAMGFVLMLRLSRDRAPAQSQPEEVFE